MTETSPQLGDVEKAIIADEIGLETGIYGQYRLKTSYQPIFRRDGATLALFGLEARLAPQLAGKQITAAEFFEQVAPVDRRFVETLSRVLHLRNHRNIGVDNIANLRLYLTIDPDLDMHDRGAGSLDSIVRIAEEADLSPAMIICEILDAPEFPMDRLAGIANELCGCGMQISIAAFRAGKSAIDRVTLIGPNVIKIAASFGEADMWSFAVEVITAFGFDWSRGRQDKSVHPFATAIGADDVRITTRWVEREPLSLLFGTMHETGHGLYEQGVSRAHHRTSLEGGASLGVHESQSRLWENLVGRSRPFWEHFFPALQARFPSQLRQVSLEQFYKGINRVRRSFIRVEADEATYNLHVMLRVELEMALLEGTIAVGDLPDAWRTRMIDYLGLEPPDDAAGVLQDIHWSAGLFGYFATYTLGNIIAAQLWEAFERACPDRDDQIRRGDFSALLAWLRREVHQHGRKYQAQELVQRITGSRIDPAPYLRYLQTKYADVYV